MIQKTGGTNVSVGAVKRHNGSSWVDVGSAKRYNGSSWQSVWPVEMYPMKGLTEGEFCTDIVGYDSLGWSLSRDGNGRFKNEKIGSGMDGSCPTQMKVQVRSMFRQYKDGFYAAEAKDMGSFNYTSYSIYCIEAARSGSWHSATYGIAGYKNPVSISAYNTFEYNFGIQNIGSNNQDDPVYEIHLFVGIDPALHTYRLFDLTTNPNNTANYVYCKALHQIEYYETWDTTRYLNHNGIGSALGMCNTYRCIIDLSTLRTKMADGSYYLALFLAKPYNSRDYDAHRLVLYNYSLY